MPQNEKPLFTIYTGVASVTVLRFSPCSRFLAAGSDDGVVRVWKRAKHEIKDALTTPWDLYKQLNGHDKDVQDLAWAPDSSLLVTVALDGSVVIWSGSEFEKLQDLPAHVTPVKGVTFDPANKYFATASDDRSVKIIRYDHELKNKSFTIEASITEPFKGSPLSTYYRRCSWSPDGNHIAAANATNGPVTTVTIINRGTWDSDISLVGHDAPCEVASFCPRIFSLDKASIGGENQAANLITVIATAGQDKTLAIWNTSNPRPLLVASNIAEKSITDTAWSPDGSKLFACSLDGTVIIAMFEEGELGWVVPLEENVNQLTRYGVIKDVKSESQVKNEEDEAPAETTLAKSVDKMDVIMGSDPLTTSNAFDAESTTSKGPLKGKIVNTKAAQKLTTAKGGKKRITPLLLTSGSSVSAPSPTESSEKSGSTKAKTVEVSKPSSGLPPGGLSSMLVRPKRRSGSEELGNSLPETKRLRYDNEVSYIRPASLSFSSDLSRVRLGVSKVRAYIKKSSSESKENFVLEIRNGSNPDVEPTSILVTCNGSLVFRDFLPKYGHLAAGHGESFWAVATEDGTLYVYSQTGRRLISGMTLGCPLSFLEAQGQYLMAVTCTGLLYMWDIDSLAAAHGPVSIAPLLDNELNASEDGLVKGPSITQCGVTSKGKALITLSNGDGFIYNDKMLTWLRVSEAWWAFGSQYWGSTHLDKARKQAGPNKNETPSATTATGVVSLIEHRTNQETMIKAGGRGKYLQRMAKNRMLKEGFENFERCTSTAHLENRVSAAIMAESSEELVSFLKMYAVRLAAEGMGKRLEELCNELLGPTVKITEPNDDTVPGLLDEWSQYVCGLDKHKLLKDVILAVGKYREIQGVVVKFARIVGVLDQVNAM